MNKKVTKNVKKTFTSFYFYDKLIKKKQKEKKMKTIVKNIFFNNSIDVFSEIEKQINETISWMENNNFYLEDMKIQNLSKINTVFVLIFKNK